MKRVTSTRFLPTRNKVEAALRNLIALEGLQSEDPHAARLALDWTDQGLDFADALHLASSLSFRRFATFDAKLENRAKSPRGIEVEEP
jgi:predicted nucleic acid-binding protein